MKKIISILLVAIMLSLACTMPAFAWATIYASKPCFEKQYGVPIIYEGISSDLDEDWWHWSIHKAATNIELIGSSPDVNTLRCYLNGDVVFHEKDLYEPFETAYVIFNPQEDKFYDITEVDLDDIDKYPMLKYDVLYYDIGTLIGDLDNDDTVTILDATEIQRIVAQISESTICDCIADFDHDGETTIFDATAIQMKLAKIEAE